MNPITPLEVTCMTLSSCLGHGVDQHLQALLQERSGLKPCNFAGSALETYIGEVEGVDSISLPDHLAEFDCRNNRLAYLCLQQDDFLGAVTQAKENYGDDRIGLFLGTSTSGVQQTEKAFAEIPADSESLPDWFHYDETQGTFSVAEFTRQYLGLNGISQVIATACSSSAKTFASAWRHIESGYCDAAIVGGVDSLCLMTLYGFNSLQLVSALPCRPADAQ
ncbi:MAG: beta-ketoacyl-[acyl-carrier-protein] synthase II, partial [Gammaproteobacteria bacterium]|nr:beta-ketoacyl-[acyl-carrier-protein] synthase II [Gammaproteobacteria bacterium]